MADHLSASTRCFPDRPMVSSTTTVHRDGSFPLALEPPSGARFSENAMKLVRYLKDGQAVAGVVRGDDIVSFAALGIDQAKVIEVVEAGPAALSAIAKALPDAQPDTTLADAKLLAPIERPGVDFH